MTAPKVASTAALVCAVGWLLKMLVMVIQGSADEAGSPDDAAFFLGLVGFVVFAGALGITLARRRSTVEKAVAAVAGVVLGALALGILQVLLLAALPGDGWWQPELAFVIAGMGAVAVAAPMARNRVA